MKHRLAQKMKKCLFFLYTFIKYKWALAYELPTDSGANSCPVCLGGNEKCGIQQLFLGPAMFETPSLHHFLLENVFKWTKSQVLKSWERDSTWSHSDACLHSTIHSFHALQKEKLLDIKQQMEEENVLGHSGHNAEGKNSTHLMYGSINFNRNDEISIANWLERMTRK